MDNHDISPTFNCFCFNSNGSIAVLCGMNRISHFILVINLSLCVYHVPSIFANTEVTNKLPKYTLNAEKNLTSGHHYDE